MSVQLTKAQLFLLMFVIQTGFVYISVQHQIIEHAHRDATIQYLIIAVVFFLQLLFYERMHQYLYLNSFVKAIYLIYWTIYITVFVSYITYILTIWVFPNTPTLVLITIFLSVCLYASISRPETAVNVGVVLIPMLLLFLIFMFLTVPNLNVTNLLPLFYDRSNTWFKGFIYCTYAFGGAETYIILRKYLASNGKISKKAIAIYFIILTSFYLLSISFTLMYFSLNEITLIPEPILYILHSVEVTFVKRLDLFFVYIWLSWSLVTIVNYVLVMRLVYFEKKIKSPKIKLFIFFTVVTISANLLIRFSIINFFKVYLVYGTVLFTFLLPMIIILFNRVRGRTLSESEKSS